MSTVQILDKQILSQSKYKLENIKFQKPGSNGELLDTENEVYFRPDAVAILLVDPATQKLLLTRQFRLPAFLNGNDTGYLIEACAGLIDEGEDEEQTAHREVKEELGYEVTNLQKVGAIYSSAGGLTEYVHLFIADFDSTQEPQGGGGLEEEAEDVQPVWYSFDDARERLSRGEFRDAKTLVLLQHLFLFGYQPNDVHSEVNK